MSLSNVWKRRVVVLDPMTLFKGELRHIQPRRATFFGGSRTYHPNTPNTIPFKLCNEHVPNIDFKLIEYDPFIRQRPGYRESYRSAAYSDEPVTCAACLKAFDECCDDNCVPFTLPTFPFTMP